MTSTSIVDTDRISLNGFDYRLIGPVRSTLGARFAPKQVIGQTTMDSHEDVSYLRWDDFSGGIGLHDFYSSGGEAPNRIWFGDVDTTHPGHTTLGPIVVGTVAIEGTFPNASVAGDDVPALCIFKSEVYAVVRNTVSATDLIRVYKYNNSTDSWGTALHTMPVGDITFTMNVDIREGFVSGVHNLIVCAGAHYAFSTNGSSWTDSTVDVMRVTFHDDALWGIDRTGAFWTSTTLGTETSKAQLPVPSAAATTDIAYISDLVTMPDASGDPRIHAATAYGLYYYDQTQNKWTKSNIVLPEARYNGRGTNIWNGDIYVSAGTGLWRGVYGSTFQLFAVGPDQDGGIPTINRGAIVDMAPGHDILAVCTDGAFPGFRNYVTTATDMRGLVLAYNGTGWQVLWQSTTASESPKKIIIGSAYDQYRIWFSTAVTTTARTVYYIDIPSERVDPHETQTKRYAASSTLETPRYHVGQDVEGLALSLLLEPHDTTATETILVEYRSDSGDYATLGTISGDADYEFQFPSSTDLSGTVFRTIQFRITLSRDSGSDFPNPFVHSMTLKFLKAIPDRQIHRMTLDLSREVGGQSPRDQYRNLRAALRKRDLLEFTFRDDNSISSEDRFYVRINQFQADMQTGLDYGGTVALELVEVQHYLGMQWGIDFWNEGQWG